MKDLRSLNLEEMEELLKDLGEPSFRAKQLFQWVHNKGIGSLEEISNFSKSLIEKLGQVVSLTPLTVATRQVSKDGTVKYLLSLEDKSYIECVLMSYQGTKSKNRNTLCISSQVGCAMGCGFCATGKGGFQRNLTAGEILDQVYAVTRLEKWNNEDFKIGNIVYMGMGEPLINFDNVIKSINILNHPLGQNIGIRRITVSTCGIVPKIRELALYELDIVLAISLHAPTDELRSEIMPINDKYPLKQLKEACIYYIENTNRRITFEYALIEGFNDKIKLAYKLAEFLRGMKCHVNLIPVNKVGEDGFNRPTKARIESFHKELVKLGIEASIREEKGVDIDAACGQLRGKMLK
ncbi:MAG: 23S rRNA (adenine(2503)-C(2))-methyltransferase RlmN [Clostridia bacterium]|nr:23S rRNA (adenine(2503)-C(2))-methyltransferase RlmN [Clostridia bacterium]